VSGDEINFQLGQPVVVVTADNIRVPMVALGPVEWGQDFRIVWVCTEDEWREFGDEADPMPWPVSYVEATP